MSVLNIPTSVAVVFFGLVFVYLGSLRTMDGWMAVSGGVVIVASAVALWLQFARRPAARHDRGSRRTGR